MKLFAGLVLILIISGFAELPAQEADYYFIFLNSNPDKKELSQEETDSIQSAHLDNISRLAQEGKLLVAGPFEGGGGVFILNTGEYNEAEEWILSDPAVRAGRFRIEIIPWKPVAAKPCLASADANMVKYSFVRYVPHLTKFNIQQSPLLFREHDTYMDRVRSAHDVITYGVFVPHDGSVLIVKGEPDKELIMKDPTVQEGMLYPDFRTVWLAEGSFCQ